MNDFVIVFLIPIGVLFVVLGGIILLAAYGSRAARRDQ